MERMQILVTAEQRRRLHALAARRGVAVTAVVRDAIDVALAVPDRGSARRGAADHLLAMRLDGPAPTPEELDELLADRFDLPARDDPLTG